MGLIVGNNNHVCTPKLFIPLAQLNWSLFPCSSICEWVQSVNKPSSLCINAVPDTKALFCQRQETYASHLPPTIMANSSLTINIYSLLKTIHLGNDQFSPSLKHHNSVHVSPTAAAERDRKFGAVFEVLEWLNHC